MVDEVLADKAKRCKKCGSLPEDWLPGVAPVWEVERGQCWGCLPIEDALAAAPKGPEGRGVFVRLRRILRR